MARRRFGTLVLFHGRRETRREARPLPLTAVAWNQSQPIVSPANVGYLRVETDTDIRVTGGQGRIYLKVRRPYDIYAWDGRLLMENVDNGGGESSGQPRTVALAPGRYVVASISGKTYRKVQVEIRAGAWTEVPAELLHNAPPVSRQLSASASPGATNEGECCPTEGRDEPKSGSVQGAPAAGVAAAPPIPPLVEH